MATLVITHVSLRPEALPAALGAGERPLVLVNPDMDVQVLLLTESFIAAGKGALEGLGAVVQVHMRVQSNLATECLFTAVMRADEGHVAAALHCVGVRVELLVLTIVRYA